MVQWNKNSLEAFRSQGKAFDSNTVDAKRAPTLEMQKPKA